jgi:hypothetical protein
MYLISTRDRLQCHQFQLLTNNKLTFCIVFFSLAFETVFLFLILDYGSLLDNIYGIIDFLLFLSRKSCLRFVSGCFLLCGFLCVVHGGSISPRCARLRFKSGDFDD